MKLISLLFTIGIILIYGCSDETIFNPTSQQLPEVTSSGENTFPISSTAPVIRSTICTVGHEPMSRSIHPLASA